MYYFHDYKSPILIVIVGTQLIYNFYLFETPDFRLLFEFWISLGFIVIEDFVGFNCGMIKIFHIDVILEALLK